MTAPGSRSEEFTVPQREIRAHGRVDEDGVLHMGKSSPVTENLVITLDKPDRHDV